MSYTGCMDERLRRHGRGTYIYRNSFFKYTGDWVHGKKEGRGVLEMADGSKIEAEFRDNEITGTGRRVWASGKTYEGDFEEGEFHGHGRMTLPSGEVYDGDYERNRRHGDGELTLPDGTVFQGKFQHNKRHGDGSEYLPGGTVFAGSWKNGLRHGPGKLVYAGGECLEGSWLDGALDQSCEAKFEDPGCGFLYTGGWKVALSEGNSFSRGPGALPTAAAAGELVPKGTGIETPEPDEENQDAEGSTASSSKSALPKHSWVASFSAGDKIEDWTFKASSSEGSVDIAEKGRVVEISTWLLQEAPSDEDSGSVSDAPQSTEVGSGDSEILPRSVALLTTPSAASAETDEASDGLSGGSELVQSETTVVSLGDDGTIIMPSMQIIEGAPAGIYEMRVTDVTKFGPGSKESGFSLLPELCIRIYVGTGGSGSKGGKKKKKKKKK